MKIKKFCLMSLVHSILAGIYIFLVALIMQNGDKIFGEFDNVLGPFLFLLLFTFSVVLMGVLIFGRPLKLYLDDEKKDAVKFLFATLGWFLLILIIVILILFLV